MTSLKLPIITDGPVRVKATVRIGPPTDPDLEDKFAGHIQPVQGKAGSHKLMSGLFKRFLLLFRDKKEAHSN